MKAVIFLVLMMTVACSSNPKVAQNESKSPKRFVASERSEEFKNIVATEDDYIELRQIISSKNWLSARTKSALELLKSMGFYIIHPDISCSFDNNIKCPSGVITTAEFKKYYAGQELMQGLVWLRSSHPQYTNNIQTNPIVTKALVYLNTHGYVFDEKSQQWKEVH